MALHGLRDFHRRNIGAWRLRGDRDDQHALLAGAAAEREHNTSGPLLFPGGLARQFLAFPDVFVTEYQSWARFRQGHNWP